MVFLPASCRGQLRTSLACNQTRVAVRYSASSPHLSLVSPHLCRARFASIRMGCHLATMQVCRRARVGEAQPCCVYVRLLAQMRTRNKRFEFKFSPGVLIPLNSIENTLEIPAVDFPPKQIAHQASRNTPAGDRPATSCHPVSGTSQAGACASKLLQVHFLLPAYSMYSAIGLHAAQDYHFADLGCLRATMVIWEKDPNSVLLPQSHCVTRTSRKCKLNDQMQHEPHPRSACACTRWQMKPARMDCSRVFFRDLDL